MSKIQRVRLLAAAGRVACEHGAGSVTVGQIIECAGVSRRTFYELFADVQECVLAAIDDAFERTAARVLPAWRSPGRWRERVRRCLVELLCLFDEDPVLARLLVVESLSAGRQALEKRSLALDRLVDALEESRRQESSGTEATRLSAEGAVGGVLAVLYTRISQDASGPLVGLTGALMGMLVLPYEGPAAARREMARPAPQPSKAEPQSDMPFRSDPFKAAGMRITYRTMRVLGTIAEHPGCSNRQIGDLAGVHDQGQASKLLARLQRIGLVANEGEGHSKGEPNAWTLTNAGRRVVEDLDVQTARALDCREVSR